MYYNFIVGISKIVGHVPGSIYTDLMYNKIIGEPYYRFNDVAYRWVAKDNWTYTSYFLSKSDLILYIFIFSYKKVDDFG